MYLTGAWGEIGEQGGPMWELYYQLHFAMNPPKNIKFAHTHT